MTIFMLMLTATLVLTGWSFVRLLKSRFIKPLDLAVISTFYYTVPLAVAGFFIYNPRNIIFLHPQAADPAIAIQSLRYALAAIGSLYLGHWAASFLGTARLGTYFKLDEGGLPRAWLAMGALIAITGLGVLQFGIPQFMSGYATESGFETATLGLALVYFAVGSMGLVVVYALLLKRFLSRRELWLLVLVAIATAIVVLVIRSKRLEIVTTFLPVAIILLASRGSLKVMTWRIILGAAALSALIAVAMIRIDDQLEMFTVNFYMLSEGLYAGHSLPGIIHRLETGQLGYENGFRFVNALLAFLPRFVWEGKDEAVYAGNLALEGVAPLGATSFLAEVVLQGGLIAVVLVHLVMGFIFERATRFEQVWDAALASGRIPGRFIAYIALTAIFIPHFRDGIIPAIKLTLQAWVFLAVLAGLQRTPAWLLQRRQAARAPAALPN